jgi:hypothetical protein
VRNPMLRLPRLPLALALVGLLAGPALAEGQAQGQADVNVTLANLPDGGATYTVEGTIPFLPKGTALDVSLIVEGRTPLVEAALFSVQIGERGQFRGIYPFPAPKVLAPLVYQTRVILQMPTQTAAVRQILARELGYTGEYVGVIATRSTPIGAPEEQAEFARTSLERCLEFIDRLDAMLARLVPAVATPAAQQPEWKAFQDQFSSDCRTVRSDLKTLKDSRVVWAEAMAMDMVNNISLALSSGVSDHARGRPVQKHIDDARAAIQRLRADVQGRLPKSDRR